MIASASALSIVGGDSIPVLKSDALKSDVEPRGPIANRDTKSDKLPVLTASLPTAPDAAAIAPATTASSELNWPSRCVRPLPPIVRWRCRTR